MSYNLILLAPNLSRAYEIATAGFHSLGFMGVTKADEFEPYVDKRDVELLRNFYGLFDVPEDPDIIVELTRQDPKTILSVINKKRDYESIEDIRKRITEYEDRTALGFCVKDNLNTSCEALFSSAIVRLNLSFKDCAQIISVAKTIAGLDNSENIRPEHIAEAIQYKSVPLSDYHKNKL